MKVVYNPESDEVREGIIVDYDQNGKLVSMEILDASEQVKEPGTMVYQAKASKISQNPRDAETRDAGRRRETSR